MQVDIQNLSTIIMYTLHLVSDSKEKKNLVCLIWLLARYHAYFCLKHQACLTSQRLPMSWFLR